MREVDDEDRTMTADEGDEYYEDASEILDEEAASEHSEDRQGVAQKQWVHVERGVDNPKDRMVRNNAKGPRNVNGRIWQQSQNRDSVEVGIQRDVLEGRRDHGDMERATRKWIKPDKFTSNVSIESYLAHFESISEYNGWTERDRLAHLKAALTGDAAQLLWDSGTHGLLTYAELTDGLKSRFGSVDHKERFACQLRALRRHEGQSLQELYNETRRLMALAYPGTAGTELNETIARDSFIAALGDREMEIKVRDRDPGDLNAAYKAAMKVETYLRPREMERGIRDQSGPRKEMGVRARQVQEGAGREDGQEVQRLRELVRQYRSEQESMSRELGRMRMLAENRTAEGSINQGRRADLRDERSSDRGKNEGDDRTKRQGEVVCFRCKNTGHFARNCRARVGQLSGTERTEESKPDSEGQQRRPDEKGVSPLVRGAVRRNVRRAAYLPVDFGKIKESCLLDSGSEACLFPTRFMDVGEVRPSDQHLYAANGTSIFVKGIVCLRAQIGGQRFEIEGFISDQVTEVILGLNFLETQGVVWDFCEGSVMIGGRKCKLIAREGSTSCRRVILADSTQLAARTEAIVPGRIVFTGGMGLTGDWMVCPNVVSPHVYVARVVVPQYTAQIPVRLINTSNNRVELPQGQILSEMEPVLVDCGGQEQGRCVDEEMERDIGNMVEQADASVTMRDRERLKDILYTHAKAFSFREDDIGHVSVAQHEIDVGDARPVRQRLRRQPPAHLAAIDEHVENMLRQGIIESSKSPWSANLIMVKKKTGEYRCCVDFRMLNDLTKKDAYALPRIDMCLDALSESAWFTTLDLRNSYYQIELNPRDREKTSFMCKKGQFQFTRMPMGLCNSGATFQRVMDLVLSGLAYEICLAYIDDIIVFSRTLSEHFERLEIVLKKIIEAGLKVRPSKSQIMQKSVGFLGHIVSEAGVKAHPEKTRQILEWGVPTCVRDVRAFVGVTSYYRKFVKGYATRVAPLTALLRKNEPFVWSDQCQSAFQDLKQALSSPPILALPREGQQYILDTDSSEFAMGAVLSQVQDGELRVIAYASKQLSRRERNYCTTRRELLAVVFYIKYFRCYLLGAAQPFRLRTDHAALAWLRKIPEPVGQQARWLEILEEFTFTVEHRPGRLHANADAMSRDPCYRRRCCTTAQMDVDGVRRDVVLGGDVCCRAVTGNRGDESLRVDRLADLPNIQRLDSETGPIMNFLESGLPRPKWDEVAKYSSETKSLWRQYERLEIEKNTLVRRFFSADGKSSYTQVIIPKLLRTEVVCMVHSGIGGAHLGRRRTELAVRARAYWPGWVSDVRRLLKSCPECARYTRSKPAKKTQLNPVLSGEPWEVLSVDITGPHPPSLAGHQYILTMQDGFTKWVEAFPIRRHTASVVARIIFEQIILRYGAPLRILSDQGAEFTSEMFAELCRLMKIDKVRSTPYHPQVNGMLERFHRTLNTMLAKVVSEHQRDWHEHLPAVLAAYRATVHEATGFSPNRLFLGKENRLPVDLVYGAVVDDARERYTADEYINKLMMRSVDDFELVRKHLGKAADTRKARYDIGVKQEAFAPGAKVWYYCPRRYKGRSPKWQSFFQGPYTVVRVIDSHVIVIKRGTRSQPIVVHRDKLKKVVEDEEFSRVNDRLRLTGRTGGLGRNIENEGSEVEEHEPKVGGRPQRTRRSPRRFDGYLCNRVYAFLAPGRQRSMEPPEKSLDKRRQCERCGTSYRDARDLQRHQHTAAHLAISRGENPPPGSRKGLVSRRSRTKQLEFLPASASSSAAASSTSLPLVRMIRYSPLRFPADEGVRTRKDARRPSSSPSPPSSGAELNNPIEPIAGTSTSTCYNDVADDNTDPNVPEGVDHPEPLLTKGTSPLSQDDPPRYQQGRLSIVNMALSATGVHFESVAESMDRHARWLSAWRDEPVVAMIIQSITAQTDVMRQNIQFINVQCMDTRDVPTWTQGGPGPVTGDPLMTSTAAPSPVPTPPRVSTPSSGDALFLIPEAVMETEEGRGQSDPDSTTCESDDN